MMYCTNCGKEIEEGYMFCTHCGTKIKNEPPTHSSVDSIKHAGEKTSSKKLFWGVFNRSNFIVGILLGLLPFFLIVSLWGIVNIITGTFGASQSSSNFGLSLLNTVVIPILFALSFFWLLLCIILSLRKGEEFIVTDHALAVVKYFSLSPLGLYLYSVLTLNLFDIVWFGRNWNAIKIATNSKMSPTWRGIFGWFMSYEQFPLILKSARINGYKKSASPALLSLTYIVLIILTDIFAKWSQSNNALAIGIIFWILVLLNPLPLLPVQKAINANNAAIDPNYIPKKNFSIPNIVLLVILVLIIVVGVASIFVSN